MSIDEFRSYIYSIHQLDINSAEGIYEESDIISIDPTEYVNSLWTYSDQHYYYDASNNFLFVSTNTSNVNGVIKYTTYYSAGYEFSSYPCYKTYQATDHTFSTDMKEINCTFYCRRYLSEYLVNTMNKIFSVTFTAGGGHIFEDGEISI